MDSTTDDDFGDMIIPLHGIAVPEVPSPGPAHAPVPPVNDSAYRFPADDFDVPSLEYQPRLRRSA